MKLYQAVRESRDQLNLTAQEYGSLLGVSGSRVSQLESSGFLNCRDDLKRKLKVVGVLCDQNQDWTVNVTDLARAAAQKAKKQKPKRVRKEKPLKVSSRISDEMAEAVLKKLLSMCRGRSQSQVAEAIGCRQSYLSELLNGKYKPSAIFAAKILGVTLEEVRVVEHVRKSRAKRDRLPPDRRLRHREGLPSADAASRGLRDESLHERRGDLLCLPRRGRGDDGLQLEEYKASQDPGVIKLSKPKLAEWQRQNQARASAGLNQLKIKVYACPSCQVRFESYSDRMCSKCKGQTTATLSGTPIDY